MREGEGWHLSGGFPRWLPSGTPPRYQSRARLRGEFGGGHFRVKKPPSSRAGSVVIWCFLSIAATLAASGATVELPGLIGRWPWGPSQAVTHFEHHAYFGNGAVLQAADVSVPEQPRVVGSVELPDLVKGLWATADAVFVAADGAGLRIVDTSSPSRMREVGFLETDKPAVDVSVAGELAYVVTRGSLVIVNISNLEQPVQVGRLELGAYLEAAVVRGGLAYVAAASRGIHIVDVWTPDDLKLISTLKLEGYAQGLTVRGRYAYVAADYGGLRVVDIWDPFQPYEVSSHEGYGNAYDVVVDGDWAYVAYHWDSILRYYVADPTDPHPHVVFSSGGPAVDVDASEDVLFSAGMHGGFHINPLEMGLHISSVDTFGVVASVSSHDGVVGVLSAHDSLQLVDSSDPSALVDLGSVIAYGGAREVALGKGYAVVLARPWQLDIVDLSQLEEPTIVSTESTLRDGRDLVLHDGFASIADGVAGYKLIDLKDPTRPELVASIDTPDAALDVAVHDGYAYVADGNTGLRVIDLWGRTPPVALKDRTIGTGAAEISSSGPAWSPGRPAEVGFLDDGGYTLAVEVDDRHVYVLEHGFGFRVIDAKNQFRPVEVGRVQLDGWGEELAIAGDCAFATTTLEETLKVIDISDPTEPVIAAEMPLTEHVQDLWVEGERLYVGQYATGFSVYDVSSCF